MQAHRTALPSHVAVVGRLGGPGGSPPSCRPPSAGPGAPLLVAALVVLVGLKAATPCGRWWRGGGGARRAAPLRRPLLNPSQV